MADTMPRETLPVTYDDAVSVLRSWVGKRVTHQAVGRHHGALKPVTGILSEGNGLTASERAAASATPAYVPSDRFALFTIQRESAVPDATFPTGATFAIYREHTSNVEWDQGRSGHALWISVD